jgi:hypothetical protein
MSPVFVITCVFDHGCNETVWSMYEGSEAGAQLFSLPQSDLDMVFDMVCMSCGQTGTSMPEEVAPAYQPLPLVVNPPPAPQTHYQKPAAAPYSQQQAAYGAQQQPPYAQPQQPPYAQQQQPPYGAQQQQPPYGAQQQQPPYGAQQQQPAYGAQQQQPPYGAQQQQPPYGAQQQQPPYGAQQQQPAYGAPQSPFGQAAAGHYQAQQTPYAQPQAQAPYTPSPHAGAFSEAQKEAETGPGSDSIGPTYSSYSDLLNKGTPNVLLGHLLVEGGAISTRCLDAALKLQEHVRKGALTSEQSVLAMKRATELGGNLDDDIIEWARNTERVQKKAAQRPPAAAPASGAAAAPGTAQRSQPARDNVAIERIADLLKQAGIVSEQDLEQVRKVTSRHGGDIIQTLVSAGKLSAKTVEAADEVQKLVAVGGLRIDKAIMALHYCERMRVGLKEALSELNIELT